MTASIELSSGSQRRLAYNCEEILLEAVSTEARRTSQKRCRRSKPISSKSGGHITITGTNQRPGRCIKLQDDNDIAHFV
ncbi:hypothetical protein LQE92_02235 [Lacrimispora sp. NSJ-141]|uniref:Uncharacterized protein n=1 Tax=Lientehia hominis TaxID=2897778 RepID=A0AAP2RG96_9FIRM|nr:hypothetical protein [Lientehia hominis]MCD2491446.1 hypothetical protein [Lientehia hominis]